LNERVGALHDQARRIAAKYRQAARAAGVKRTLMTRDH
jgi:hypothetical protein